MKKALLSVVLMMGAFPHMGSAEMTQQEAIAKIKGNAPNSSIILGQNCFWLPSSLCTTFDMMEVARKYCSSLTINSCENHYASTVAQNMLPAEEEKKVKKIQAQFEVMISRLVLTKDQKSCDEAKNFCTENTDPNADYKRLSEAMKTGKCSEEDIKVCGQLVK